MSMRRIARPKLFWAIMPLVLGLLVPSLIIFYLEVFVGHIHPIAAVTDILQRQFAKGHNLFLLDLFGLIPFVALSSFCLIRSRRVTSVRLRCLTIGGLIGILCLMVPAHYSIWYPLYGGGDMSSTAVVGFVFIPFFCLPTLGIGLILGRFFAYLLERKLKRNFVL